MERTINISQLAQLRRYADEYSALGHDYIFCHIKREGALNHIESVPFRVDGLAWVLCMEGEMNIDINMNHCTMRPGSLLVTGPGTILYIHPMKQQRIDCYLLFVSADFMRDTNIDPGVLNHSSMHESFQQRSALHIEKEESDMLRRYFDLLHHSTGDSREDLFLRSISRCLIAAMCYQVLKMMSHRAPEREPSGRPRSRRTSYINDFMALVHKHHRHERTVAFYASRMYITPKYLSLIVKEATGRSAAEWIDDFVILEAKNMLRFSGKNIQQVAYELNFASQSSFGKYFKHLTGMSPSHYQRQ